MKSPVTFPPLPLQKRTGTRLRLLLRMQRFHRCQNKGWARLSIPVHVERCAGPCVSVGVLTLATLPRSRSLHASTLTLLTRRYWQGSDVAKARSHTNTFVCERRQSHSRHTTPYVHYASHPSVPTPCPSALSALNTQSLGLSRQTVFPFPFSGGRHPLRSIA